METYTGHLDKMKVALVDGEVAYELRLDTLLVPLNQALGLPIRIEYHGAIHCSSCGKKTRKSYSQGHCYPCSMSLASCDMCILKPELCHYDKGTCREPAWGEAHCLQPHYVYLSNASGLKVGITRAHNIPSRWIDQGAGQGLTILKVQTRLQSGELEVMFKDLVADKTNWRKMLSKDCDELDLKASRDAFLEECAEQMAELEDAWGPGQIETLPDAEVVSIQYPVREYPKKIKSHNLDKTPVVDGKLMGIKGQYLLLDTGVINIRKYSAYEVDFSIGD